MKLKQLTNITTTLYGLRKRQQTDKTMCGLNFIEAFCAQKDKNAHGTASSQSSSKSLYGVSGLAEHRWTYQV